MVVKQPICCPTCGTVVVADAKSLEMYVLSNPIRCPKCGIVVISPQTVVSY